MNLIESIKKHALAIPEVAAWPELVSFFERTDEETNPNWRLPLLACQAVGGDVSMAIPGAAAISCMYVSIILVDDMLDEDPRGKFHDIGYGSTANLALATQAVAFRVIERAVEDTDILAAITSSLSWLALGTSFGQYLDAENLEGEENYWRVVQAKSTPFYGAALHIGALLGGADTEVANGLRDLGMLIGEIIQIHDDLVDAFQTPAGPDWQQGRNSLPMLYALTADHPDQAKFIELLPRIDEAQALQDAHQILINSGAVSYCAYHLIKRHQQARKLLASIPLVDPTPVTDLLERQTQPVANLLEAKGEKLPADLLANSSV